MYEMTYGVNALNELSICDHFTNCNVVHNMILLTCILGPQKQPTIVMKVYLTKSCVSEAEEAAVSSVDDGVDDVSQRARTYLRLRQGNIVYVALNLHQVRY